MTNPKLIEFLSFSLSFDNRNSGVLRSNSLSLCIQWRRPESMRIASKSWTQLGGLGRSIDIKGAKNRKQWRPLLHTRQKLMYPIMKGSKLWQRDEIAKLTKFSKDNHSCDLHLRKKKGDPTTVLDSLRYIFYIKCWKLLFQLGYHLKHVLGQLLTVFHSFSWW